MNKRTDYCAHPRSHVYTTNGIACSVCSNCGIVLGSMAYTPAWNYLTLNALLRDFYRTGDVHYGGEDTDKPTSTNAF